MRDDGLIGVDDRALDDLALEALAEAHTTTPSARLRGRLLGVVRAEGDAARAGRSLRRWRVVGSLAAGVAIVTTALLGLERTRGDAQRAALSEQSARLAGLATENAGLERRLDEQGRTLVGLRTALESQAQMLRVLSGPRTITAKLAPEAGFAGSGRVMVDAETGEAHVVLAGLPDPGAGKTYELWAIRGDRPPEPAGLVPIGPEPATAARVARIPAPSDVAAFAVSIEPAGGSPSPTGPIVLVGKVT